MTASKRTRTPFGPAFYERVCLLTPDRPDPRDFDLTSYFGPAARGLPIPTARDYSAETGPVGDQGDTGSCVGWAVAHGLRRWLTGRGRRAPRLSVRFLWMGTKEIDVWPLNVINEMAGTSIRSAMKFLNQTGVPLERFYPFDEELLRYDFERWNRMLESAHAYRIGRYYSLDDNEAREIHLAHGGPFVCGVPVHDNFSRLDPRGVVPEPKGRLRGGHAVLVVGYDRNRRIYKFMNSWGAAWGRRGIAHLTYDWMDEHAFSAWAAARV